jgi:hypothetical protein
VFSQPISSRWKLPICSGWSACQDTGLIGSGWASATTTTALTAYTGQVAIHRHHLDALPRSMATAEAAHTSGNMPAM